MKDYRKDKFFFVKLVKNLSRNILQLLVLIFIHKHKYLNDDQKINMHTVQLVYVRIFGLLCG